MDSLSQCGNTDYEREFIAIWSLSIMVSMSDCRSEGKGSIPLETAMPLQPLFYKGFTGLDNGPHFMLYYVYNE